MGNNMKGRIILAVALLVGIMILNAELAQAGFAGDTIPRATSVFSPEASHLQVFML